MCICHTLRIYMAVLCRTLTCTSAKCLSRWPLDKKVSGIKRRIYVPWCYIWSSQLLCSGLVPRPSGSGDETTSVVEMLLHSIVYWVTTLWEFHMKCVQTLSCDAVKHFVLYLILSLLTQEWRVWFLVCLVCNAPTWCGCFESCRYQGWLDP